MLLNVMKVLSALFLIHVLGCSEGIVDSDAISKQWIAYVDYDEQDDFLINLINTNGENRKLLIKGNGYCRNMAWMKIKPELAFIENLRFNTGKLLVYSLQKGRIDTLWETTSKNYLRWVSTSYDNEIAFMTSSDTSDNYTICVINRDGSGYRELLDVPAREIKFVNNQIYFINMNDVSEAGDNKIARINSDGSGYEVITNNFDNGIFDYDISPDGTTMIYMYAEGPGDGILYQADFNGNGHKPIFYLDSAALSQKSYEYINDPTFSPDGKKIVFSQKSSVITVLDADSYEYEQFDLGIPANIYDVTWIGNGQKLVFTTNEDPFTMNLCFFGVDGRGYNKSVSITNSSFVFKVSPLYFLK